MRKIQVNTQTMLYTNRLQVMSNYKSWTDNNCSAFSGDMIADIAKETSAKYFSAGHLFYFSSIQGMFVVNGRKTLIVNALKELFDNAFRFSLERSIVSVRVYEKDTSVVISIVNSSDHDSAFNAAVGPQQSRFDDENIKPGVGMQKAISGICSCQGSLHVVNNPSSGIFSVEVLLVRI